MAKKTLIQSLEVFAKEGKDCTYMDLWDTQITRLRKQGFYVEIRFKYGRTNKYYCSVSWKDATIGAAKRLWKITQQESA